MLSDKQSVCCQQILLKKILNDALKRESDLTWKVWDARRNEDKKDEVDRSKRLSTEQNSNDVVEDLKWLEFRHPNNGEVQRDGSSSLLFWGITDKLY